jgi:hypothetical protein
VCGVRGRTSAPAARGTSPALTAIRRPAGFVFTSAAARLAGLLVRETPHLQRPEQQHPMHAGGPLPSLGWCAAGCQRGRPRFRRAAVNASPGPPHLDTSSPNAHPSSQPTPNRMRAVPADQLPHQDRPRTWWGQRLVASAAVAAFVPAELCPDHLVAAGTLTQAELPARDLGHGRLLVSCLPLSACCHHVGPFLAHWPGRLARSARAGLVMLAAPACGTGGKEGNSAGLAGIQKHRI